MQTSELSIELGMLVGVMFSGFYFGLIGAFFSGLSPEIIETKTIPNQGIHLSVKNATYGGLIFGLIGGLIGGLFGWVFGGPIFGLLAGALLGSLMGFRFYGGTGVHFHYTLRLILIIQGHTPSDYARFLDYAVDRIILQKVGGGYRFIHRMLLEHFANMQEAK